MALLTLEKNVEDYLKDIEIENFDESMSFMDCAYYVVAEGERMWNDIMKEMAIEELRYLSENGVEMVYEAVDIKGFFNKAVEFFKKLAGKFAGWFKKAFEWVEDHISRNKAYVKKHEDDIKKGAQLIPSDGISMKKFYKFEKLKSAKFDESAMFDNLNNQANSVYGLNVVLNDKSTKEDVKEQLDKVKDKDQIKSTLDTIRAAYVGGGSEGIAARDFKKSLVSFYFGEKQENVKLTSSDINVSEIIDDLKNCVDTKRKLKSTYKKVKAELNKIIGEIKKFQKAVDKADEAKEAKLNYAKHMIQLYKGFVQINSVDLGVVLSAHKARCAQSLAISTKLVGFVKKDAKGKGKDDKKEDKKEEVKEESFTYQWEDGMNFFTSDLL